MGRRFAVWVIAITLLALALRSWKLGTPSFWIDELFTVRDASGMWVGEDQSIFRVFGYLPAMISLWLQGIDLSAVGNSRYEDWAGLGITEVGARLHSVVLGALAIPIFGYVARPILGGRGTILLILLLALSPWHLQRSQDARFYSSEFLFAGLGVLCYARAIFGRGHYLWIIGAGLSLTLAVMSHPTAATLLAVVAIDVVLSPWTGGRRYPAWVIGVCIGVCLAMLAAVSVWLTGLDSFWEEFVGDVSHSPLDVATGVAYMSNVAVVAAAICGGCWLWSRNRRLAVFLLLVVVLPVVSVMVLGLFSRVGIRYAFPSLVGVLMLASIALDAAWASYDKLGSRALRMMPAALVFSVLGLQLMVYYAYGHGGRPRWRQAFERIEREAEADDVIYAQRVAVGRFYLGRADVNPISSHLTQSESGQRQWLVFLEEARPALSGLGPPDEQTFIETTPDQQKTRVVVRLMVPPVSVDHQE